MAWLYRRNTNSPDATPVAKPYKLNATYAATAQRFDLVKLDANGEVVKAAAADTSVLGVLQTVLIKIQGETDTYGEVMTTPGAVFEVPASAAGAKVGTAYGINASQNIDVANTTTTVAKVVAVRSNGNLDVVISGRQLV